MNYLTRNFKHIILSAVIISGVTSYADNCEKISRCTNDNEMEFTMGDMDYEEWFDEDIEIESMEDVLSILMETKNEKEINRFKKYTEKNFPGYLKTLEEIASLEEEPILALEGLEDIFELYECKDELENDEDKVEYQQWLKFAQLEVSCSMIAWDILNEKEGSTKVATLKKQLKEKVTETFELNQKIQKAELKEEMEFLQKENKRLEKRDQNKEKIIDRRIEELTKPLDDELDWN